MAPPHALSDKIQAQYPEFGRPRKASEYNGGGDDDRGDLCELVDGGVCVGTLEEGVDETEET